MSPTELKDLNASELREWMQQLGLPPYRAGQIRKWLYARLASTFDEMTDLPKPLRLQLKEAASIAPLVLATTQTSEDGTRKYLFRLRDGLGIESVLIPERVHCTLCISSQAGCAMGCVFCATGRQGLKRSLTAGEILEQIIQVKRSLPDPSRLTNIVFMGMGEPLANYDAVLKAIGTIIAEDGLNFSHRRVTVSTCGLVPRIAQLGRDVSVNLAVSLNAADDATRSRLMPVNRTYPLDDLLRVCRTFPLPNRRMITFEYILIAGVNDSDAAARELADRLGGMRAKFNLIPLNPHAHADFRPPTPERILAFQQVLIDRHFTAILRKSKGADIQAACGQLSGTYNDMDAASGAGAKQRPHP